MSNKPIANSPAVQPSSPSLLNRFAAATGLSGFVFVPDYTEHPKPKRRKSVVPTETITPSHNIAEPGSEDTDVTFLQDFVSGGVAGSISVIIGHPLDTMKVRVQNSTMAKPTVMSTIREFGGVSSLFRGMSAPLGTAALVNAIIFSSYGMASIEYDKFYTNNNSLLLNTFDMPLVTHDPWQKSMTCGMFAGFVQCLVICPMEHIKCRLQTQESASSAAAVSKEFYKGPVHATERIMSQHGIRGLYKGWWSTFWREVPAFGAYFATYDFVKDRANTIFAKQAGLDHEAPPSMAHTHTWLASALAGGLAGSCSWGLIMPMDVIKTHIQTAPLNSSLTIRGVAQDILQKYGWKHLFRGFGITLVRAFPVNGTIFPVYEYTLMHMKERGWGCA